MKAAVAGKEGSAPSSTPPVKPAPGASAIRESETDRSIVPCAAKFAALPEIEDGIGELGHELRAIECAGVEHGLPALAMALSSVSVVGNALRLRTTPL